MLTVPVEKVIISQESLGRFINDLVPGAYASLTKVDFKKLDHQSIRPVGIYGPKQGIVSFMIDAAIIDAATCVVLAQMNLVVDSNSGAHNCYHRMAMILLPSQASTLLEVPMSTRKLFL